MRQMNMKIQIGVGLEGMEDLRNFFSILFLFIIKKTKWVAELDLVELMDISEEIFTGVTELVMVSETADTDWAVVMEISGEDMDMVSEDAVMDSEDAVMDSEDAVMDSEDAVMDSEDAVMDSEDMVSEDAVMDSEDMVSEDMAMVSEDAVTVWEVMEPAVWEDMDLWAVDFPTLGLTTMEDVKPTFLVL
jgi:hypothetical protein